MCTRRSGRPIVPRLLAIALVAGLVAALPTAPASAADGYAPLDRPGPALTVPAADLAASYRCTGDFSSPLEPVLALPGTGTTPDQAFEWNYGNYFAAEGRPYCTVTLPLEARGDIQLGGEYIVHAIRRTYEQAGRPIATFGPSQGGMSPRWALRFWPDTRAMVADQIGVAPSHHGTADSGCSAAKPCTIAHWQQESDSAFLAALNSGAETFAGIDYTVIYSRSDTTVPPDLAPLPSGPGTVANIATQEICPATTHGHLTVGTIDPIAHALVMDALNHAGPADASRIDPAVCNAALMPGVTVDPATLNVLLVFLNAALEMVPGNLGAAPFATAEPPLACYVWAAGCSGTSAPPTTSQSLVGTLTSGLASGLVGLRLGRVVTALTPRP